MIDPTTITPTALPAVALDERSDLPTHAAIYFVLAGDTVLYIGQAGSLLQRWAAHHRLLQQFNEYGNCRIAWVHVDDPSLLDDLEAACKAHFQPVLNGQRVPGGTRPVGAGQTWIEARIVLEDRARLNAWAKRYGTSVSFIVRRLIEEALAAGRDEEGIP